MILPLVLIPLLEEKKKETKKSEKKNRKWKTGLQRLNDDKQ